MSNATSMQFISKLCFSTQSKNKSNDFKAGNDLKYEPAVLLPHILQCFKFISSNTLHEHGKMLRWTSWSHATKLLKAIYYIPFSNTTWPTFLGKHTHRIIHRGMSCFLIIILITSRPGSSVIGPVSVPPFRGLTAVNETV